MYLIIRMQICTILAGADPGSELSHLGLAPPRDRDLGRWATPVSGTGITGGGSGYAALLAHAEGVLYGMELGKINNQHTPTF